MKLVDLAEHFGNNRARIFLRNRAVILLVILLLAFGCVASADTVYSVSGTFGTTVLTGPLNGGSFDGTFCATLPTTGTEYLNLDSCGYSITLFSSSGVEVGSISSSTAGSMAFIGQEPGPFCNAGPSSSGLCDFFLFHGGLASNLALLELITPVGFTGGNVYPFYSLGGVYSHGGLGGAFQDSFSIVTSGTIEPAAAVPEPSSLLLVGLVMLAFLCVGRNRLLAWTDGDRHVGAEGILIG
jgi:hypothetical protein